MGYGDRVVRLSDYTTLRLGGTAETFVSPGSEEEVIREVRAADARGEPVLILGGGSNLVVGDGPVPGTVVKLGPGLDTLRVEREGDFVLLEAGAGLSWDAFVARAIAAGASGLEALSGIPGLVGATPMQNVGAYGQEVADTLASLRAFDREEGGVRTFGNAECGFGYRHSRFRNDTRFVILSVTFRAPASVQSAPIAYEELAQALGVAKGERAPAAQVRDTVIALRRKKGMVLDPTDPDSVSAGSFFTNPIVADVEAVRARVRVELGPDVKMPEFPMEDGRTKLAAAWLIERAGFPKGYGEGPVGISRKHTLALVHRGGGTTAQLLELARTIQQGVSARFGVSLTPEPIFVG
jgi:UDP-N-acetylmuramate dehydrogenase